MGWPNHTVVRANKDVAFKKICFQMRELERIEKCYVLIMKQKNALKWVWGKTGNKKNSLEIWGSRSLPEATVTEDTSET